MMQMQNMWQESEIFLTAMKLRSRQLSLVIAYIAALYGMEVIDSGVAVLSMHAPWEVTSKADIYEAKKAYKAFLLEA